MTDGDTEQRSAAERRLLLVIAAVVFVDTVFYAAIAPLLPALARQLHLSKASAGLMTAAYPIGTLIGSLPGGVLAVRAGPKRTVYAGLVLLAVSTLGFALLNSAAALDAARFVEGVGGACTWAGGLAWIVAESAPGRRGGLLGSAISAAIAGALFGPVIGTIAAAIGRAPTFSAVVVLSLALCDQARRLPLRHHASGQGMRHLVHAVADPRVVWGMCLCALPAIASGLINVLAPLRLHRLGAGAAAIGLVFLIGAAVEAVVTPAVGRLSDRRGRLLPMRFGLAGVALLLALFTLPRTALQLGALVVVIAATLGAFWAPAMAMLADAAEAMGLDQGLAAALMNLAWAGGQVTGSGAGGAVAKAAGDGLPMHITAGLCVLALALSAVRIRAPRRRAAVR